MTGTLIEPGALSLTIAAIFVLASVALLRLQKVRLWSDFLVAALRCALQLLAVGFVLRGVFRLDNALVILSLLGLMLGYCLVNLPFDLPYVPGGGVMIRAPQLIASLILATVIGVLGGVLPAIQAARATVVDALR